MPWLDGLFDSRLSAVVLSGKSPRAARSGPGPFGLHLWWNGSFPCPGSLLFFQAFQQYLRRRRQRPPIVVRDFDPSVVAPASVSPAWVDLLGRPASPPRWDRLPSPAEVLAGSAAPDFGGLRMRDPNAFRCGNLHYFASDWDALMGDVEGYGVVRPWIHRGVHIPDFFQHYKGVFNGRNFDSDVPPPMYFQNDGQRCRDFEEFVTKTILQRLKEGSIKWLGRVGVDPPPVWLTPCLWSLRSQG